MNTTQLLLVSCIVFIIHNILKRIIFAKLGKIEQKIHRMLHQKLVFKEHIINGKIKLTNSVNILDNIAVHPLKLKFAIMILREIWVYYAFSCKNWYQHPWHEGLLTSYALIHDNKNAQKLQLATTKLYWYNIFTKYKIKTPQVRAYTKMDGTLVTLTHPVNHTLFVKPNIGCCGIGTYTTSWTKFCNTLSRGKLAMDLIPESHCHIRFITLYDNINKVCKALAAYQICDHTSNVSNFGTVTQIPLSKIETSLQLRLTFLHSTEFPIICSICWDITKGHVLEGNIPGAICWKSNCKQILSTYHKISQGHT